MTGHTPPPAPKAVAEMATFDALPAELRREIDRANVGLQSRFVMSALRRGETIAAIVKAVRSIT